MVGYDSDHKGYRIFHPVTKKVYISTQVIFEESVFPLEGSDAVDICHSFATSAIGGIPKYPASGSTIGAPRKTTVPFPSPQVTTSSALSIIPVVDTNADFMQIDSPISKS